MESYYGFLRAPPPCQQYPACTIDDKVRALEGPHQLREKDATRKYIYGRNCDVCGSRKGMNAIFVVFCFKIYPQTCTRTYTYFIILHNRNNDSIYSHCWLASCNDA